MTASPTAVTFEISPDQAAASPPEHRGLRRDGVRLLVARPSVVEHRRFFDLPGTLKPGGLPVNKKAGPPLAAAATAR